MNNSVWVLIFYLIIAIGLLAIAITVYPTLKERAKKHR